MPGGPPRFVRTTASEGNLRQPAGSFQAGSGYSYVGRKGLTPVAKSSRNRQQQQQARERIAQLRAEEARRRRRRIQFGAGVGAVVVIGAAVGITLAATGGGSQNGGSGKSGSGGAALSTLGALKPAPPAGALGPEGVPVPNAAPLAGLSTAATGQTVHGISCQTNEQTLFHIHAHLTVFVNGTARQVPAAIGIPGAQAQNTASGPFIGSGTCFCWLHTHAADGIIHIESPVKRIYTLGDFFAEWGQPLSSSRVGPATGPVTAILNGKVFTGNPAGIPLTAHAQIQLEVGKPLVAPESISFPSGL
jgi:hypothetical protein